MADYCKVFFILKSTSMEKKVVDSRSGFTWVDNAIIDDYIPFINWKGALVYLCLCRHANKQGVAFPSISKMTKLLKVSEDSVIKGIQALEKYNIVKVSKQKTKRGFRRNQYLLTNTTEWNLPDKNATPHRSRTGYPTVDEPVSQPAETLYNNKHIINNKHNNNILITNASSEKEPAKYSFQAKLDSMIKAKDKRMPVIALYWSQRGIKFDNNDTYSAGLKRELRAAGLLKGYPLLRIQDVIAYLKETADFKWTLETVHKYIDEDLSAIGKTEGDQKTDKHSEAWKKFHS